MQILRQLRTPRSWLLSMLKNKVWIDKNEVDPQFVKDQIELLLADNPKSPVIIQADAKSSIKTLNEVAQAARSLGIVDVSIAVQKE
jgi:biopolymer transport protein ExbD